MGNKQNFTPEEWIQVVESVMLSGIAVSAADPSGLWGTLKEGFASSSALKAAKVDANSNKLILAAVAEFYPNRFRYAGSMSGFLNPSNTFVNGALHDGMMQFGGADTNDMWGPPQFGRWKWHDPTVRSQLLIDNNTRIWVFSPQTLTASDPAAMIGYADQAQGSNRSFYAQYRSNGGSNAHFDFPTSGDHGWGSWAPQLGAMSGDIAAAIR